MRIQKKWRYFCDFCKKSGGQRAAIEKHERYCTMNPRRECRMCEWNEPGSETKPALDLAAILVTEAAVDPRTIRTIPDALLTATNGCPACTLAVVRQSGVSIFEFDFTKASGEMWEQVRAAEYEEEMRSLVYG